MLFFKKPCLKFITRVTVSYLANMWLNYVGQVVCITVIIDVVRFRGRYKVGTEQG